MNDKSTDAAAMPAALAELTFGAGRTTLQIDSMEKAWRLARLALAAKAAPADSPEAMTICILYGNEIGLPPFQSMQKISIIGGHPVIWGDAALSLCMNSPFFEDIEERIEGEGDQRTAYCTVMRRNQSPKTSTFSVADARKAGLWDEQPTKRRRMKYDGWFAGKPAKAGEWLELPNDAPWFCYPDRMLTMRARGFRLRDSFPDVLGGLYLREEFTGTTIEGEFANAAPAPLRGPEPPEPPAPPPPPVSHETPPEPPEPPESPPPPQSYDPEPPEPPSPAKVASAVEAYRARALQAQADEELDMAWRDLIEPVVTYLENADYNRLVTFDDEQRGRLAQGG